MDFLLGFIFSLLIAFVAYKKHSLDLSGFISAIFIGTFVYGFGSYIVFTCLMVFFISSSLISKFGQRKIEEKKGRNWIQVFANAFLVTIFALVYFINKDIRFMVLSLIVIATVTSDTWASEIGKLSKGKTVSILTYKILPQGESGGVSILGMAAALLGSLVIAVFSFILFIAAFGYTNQNLIYAFVIFGAGFLGNIIDSYLGILIQEKYLTEEGDKIENVIKRNVNELVSGIKYINNNAVNFLTGVLNAVIFTIVLF